MLTHLKILTLLDGIPFGKYHFEAGVLLRNSLLVSSMLFNSEAWYNVSKSELDLLETVDAMLLRGILKAPKSTPKEMLFLELGVVPFREIIRQRRLGFLFYILHENQGSMIHRFFESQRKNKSSKDWVTTILRDIKELNLDMEIEDIRRMKKDLFMNTVKRKVQHKTLKDLENLKEKHSKTKHLKHPVLKLQDYLKPGNMKSTKDECQLIFKLRSRITALKLNQKNSYESYECEVCKVEDESQEHVFECVKLIEMQKDDDNEGEKPAYGKIMDGNVQEKIWISKSFSKKLKIIERLRKEK